MKHYKLLMASLLLAIGGGSAVAQTDVTGQYIKNPGFEGTSTQFLQINKDGRGVQKPEGWSVEWYQDNSDTNGMTYVADNLNQDGKKWAAKNGKSYFARMRYKNSTLYLRQTLRDLKPGKYTLSFSATGYRPKGNSIFNVTVGDKKADINLSTKDEAAWADYNIDFEIAEGQKYATITITADRKDENFKIGIDDFKLTYDGSSYYPSLITKATSLYNENKDWAKQADELNIAITVNSGKTEVADINGAIDAIEKAMAAFKEVNTIDVTAKIVNPNFDSNINGWTCEGGDGNKFQHQTSSQTNFNGGFLEKWRESWNGSYNQKNFDVFQKLTNLPKGEYTVKAAIMATMQGGKETIQGEKETKQKYQNMKHGGPYYIDNEHGVWFYGTSGKITDMDWANTENNAFVSAAGAEYRTATVKVDDGNLTIGFKGVGSPNGSNQLGTYANWIACDNWTLSYFGFDPTALLAQIKDLKSNAEALLKNEDYKNITGDEKTELESAKNQNPEGTKSALEAAINKLETAISAFTSAQPKYQALVDAKALEQEELAYASKDKYTAFTTSKEATATSAADAETKANAIISARRAYIESNGMAKGVVGAENCTSNLQVTVAGENIPGVSYAELIINSGQGATDSEGNITNKYYDTNGTFWGSDNLKAQMTQNASGLKSGKYLLTVAARGDASLKNLTLTAGYSSINLPVQTPNNIFGNNWDDYSIETIVDNSGNLNIKIEGQTNKSHAWFSFNNFRLYRLGDLDAVTLDEAADNAIEAKEAADVTLKRTFVANKWNTLVLPFAVSAEDVKTTFGADAKIVEYSNADDANINFTTSTKGIEANVPVLIMPAAVNVENTYTFNGVSIVVADPKADGTSYSFVGSYKPYDLVNDDYMLYADKWWKTEAADSYKIKAFRAYIKAKTPAAAKQLNLVIDGQTTGLKLNTVNGNIEGETYNIAGQRVANSYKGLVIKNGKKIIKK